MAQLVPGDISASSGLAQRIFNYRNANREACGYGSEALTAEAEAMLRADSYCVAKAVVDEITANARAYVGIALGSLQQDSANANTQPPTAEREIPVR